MNKADMQRVMYAVFNECDQLRGAGQAEYAGGEDAFGNFNRLAASLQLSRQQVLLVYAQKHIDGITSYVAGHRSQREDVRGRINDLIVYMCLLRGMIDEEDRVGALLHLPQQATPTHTVTHQPIPRPPTIAAGFAADIDLDAVEPARE